MTGREDVHWAPRVSKEKIRRLYESDALGLLDGELLDDVGTLLYQRCQSILDVYHAKRGRVRCPVCDRSGQETMISYAIRSGEEDHMINCPVCGWQISYRDYARTFKRRQLNSGGAMSAFTAYLAHWPAARTPEQKMIAVDRLIHAFHYSLRDTPDLPSRPAALNLIKGRLEDVIRFLNELSYGTDSSPDRDRTRQAWQHTLDIYQREYIGGVVQANHEQGKDPA